MIVLETISAGARTRRPILTMRKDQRAGVLVAVAHDVLRRESFDTLADLVDAIKTRAARLRIRYDADTVTAALATVGRSRRLVADRGRA